MWAFLRIPVPRSGALAPRPPAAASRASADAACTADQALTRLYAAHSRPLLRLAALLVHDAAAAQEITEAAFAAAQDARRQLNDTDATAAFLRRAVVSQARRAQPRHRGTERPAAPDRSPARRDVGPGLARGPLTAALRSLPERHREAVVLRYYAGLPEAQTAAAMGVSRAAVKRDTRRALAALRTKLDHELGSPGD